MAASSSNNKLLPKMHMHHRMPGMQAIVPIIFVSGNCASTCCHTTQ